MGHGSVPRRPSFPDQVELHWGGTANNELPVSFYFSKEKPGNKKSFKKDINSPLLNSQSKTLLTLLDLLALLPLLTMLTLLTYFTLFTF